MYNEHQGFTIGAVFVFFTIISMIVVGYKRYYLYQDRKKRLFLIKDILSEKIKEIMIVCAVTLGTIMMIESWQPIVELFMGTPRFASYVLAGFTIVILCVLYYAILRFTVCVSSRKHRQLLQQRSVVILRSRRRKNALKKMMKK